MSTTNSHFNNGGITRRQFVQRTSLAGGSLVLSGFMPGPLLSNDKISYETGIQDRSVLSVGWKIKPIDPVNSLDASFFSGAAKASEVDGWITVPSAPAMPHGILLHHKKIEEPWNPFGMEKCYWVSQKDWVYSVSFNSINPSAEYRLVFKELKGSVNVYLNGEFLVGHADQAQPLMVDITGKLMPKNHLVLHFERAAPLEKPDQPDPAKRQKNGTYLGPNPMLYTAGIVDEVILERTAGTLIDEIITDFSLNDSFSRGLVKLAISGKSKLGNIKIQIRLFDPDGQNIAESSISAKTRSGMFRENIELEVSDPALWWPRGYGNQNLYRAEVALLISGKVHQRERRTIGFRKITMPENLHFFVNGKPVFLRGGDWVTPDLLSEVWDQQRMEVLFALAENANFNAFRIWGVVEAPNDRFYEMANERGFLLWQDFTRMPFNRDSDKLEVAEKKATQFLIRLKHHPCILMWCGINESAMWWHEDYNNDFTDNGPWPGLEAALAVGQVCRELDPDRYYIPSAPFGGENANDPREGSTNGYTNMWYVPGYDYLNFASEDTRIACPTLNSMEKFMLPEEICPEAYTTLALPGNIYPFPDTWLAYTAAESWKKTGPVEQLYDATDPSSLANRIGMAEGIYYRDVVERQRRGRPATDKSEQRSCGGYLVWKYNDSWPEIYSAKVDYFLEPYHAYYTLKAAYTPVILSFDIGTFIYLWAVNDSIETISGTVKIQLYHLQLCEFRKEIVREISVPPGKSKVVVRLDEAGIRAFRKEHVLFAEFKDQEGKVIARTNALSDIERRCVFPDARLDVTIKGNALIITTDKFARNINLEGNANGEKLGWFFEDNYFDLFPGETKVVRILGRHKKGIIRAKPWYSEFVTRVNWEYV